MRYRITIEIDTDSPRMAVNRLAMEMNETAITRWCNPVYVATEVVENEQRTILKEVD